MGLFTIAGRLAQNGTLAEAHAYDTCGQAVRWSYNPAHGDRDGDVLSDEFARIYPDVGSGESATGWAIPDMNMDGDTGVPDVA